MQKTWSMDDLNFPLITRAPACKKHLTPPNSFIVPVYTVLLEGKQMTENIIYKVGNMNTLGFEPSEPNNPRSDKVDSYGITWREAIIGCTSMMFTHKTKPQSLSALWIGGTLYQYDHKQVSKEVRDLISASTLDDPKPEILDLVEVVSEYAIPTNGTELRFMFSAFTKSMWADITRKNDRAEKIRQKIQEIAEINRL